MSIIKISIIIIIVQEVTTTFGGNGAIGTEEVHYATSHGGNAIPCAYETPVTEKGPCAYETPVTEKVPCAYETPVTEKVPCAYETPVTEMPCAYETPVTEKVPCAYESPVTAKVIQGLVGVGKWLEGGHIIIIIHRQTPKASNV